MAKLFQITLPEGLSTLALDSQGHGTVHYSVKNVSARPIDGRAVLVCLPQGDSNNGIQKNWITLDGKAERHFAVNGEDTFTVNIAVPARSPAGTYGYRLDVVSLAKPDEGDSSQPTKFTVIPAAPPPKKWGLIAAIVTAVLIVAGIAIWAANRPKTPTVPNLVGMTVPNATAALTTAKLQLNPTQLQVPGGADSVGTVVAQTPAAGTSVAANSSVQLSVGVPQKVTVPSLIGMSVTQAQQALPSGLTLGTPTTLSVYNPSFPVGSVISQSPTAGQSVNPNTVIALSLNPAQAINPVQPAPVQRIPHW
jgi:hypothetical protein